MDDEDHAADRFAGRRCVPRVRASGQPFPEDLLGIPFNSGAVRPVLSVGGPILSDVFGWSDLCFRCFRLVRPMLSVLSAGSTCAFGDLKCFRLV